MSRSVPLWLCVVLLFVLSILAAPVASVGDQADQPLPQLQAVQKAFQQVIEHVSPSVVGLRVKRRYVATLPGTREGHDAGTFEQLVVVNASGTVIRPDGLILTNEHVVQSAHEIEVTFHDGRTLAATILAADPRADLAVLRVERTRLEPAKFCNWATVARGQWTIALGNPFGLGNDGRLSASVGIIANLGRRLPGLGEVDDRLYHDMIQTTAAINPGNSGGPLLNIHGELVGIVTAMHTRAAVDQGVGFAIPLTPARRRLIDQLAQGHPIQYGYLGVTVRSPEQRERDAAGVGQLFGVVVLDVEADGPAARAKLRQGDLIICYNRQQVRGPADLAEQVGTTPIGRQVPVDVYRSARRLTLSVTIERRQVSRVSWMRGGAMFWRGLRLANLTPDSYVRMNADADVTGVVVIDVADNSPAERARVQIGDVIERVGNTPVGDIAGFRRCVSTQAGTVSLTVRSRGTLRVPP
jgi:serine protease Do